MVQKVLFDMMRSYLIVKSLFAEVNQRALISLALQLFLGLTEGASLLMIIPLLSIAGVKDNGQEASEIPESFSRLFDAVGLDFTILSIVITYILMLSFYSLLKYFQSINTSKISQTVVLKWRINFFKELTKASWSSFKKHKAADYLNIINTETRKIGVIVNQVVHLVGNLILILVYIGVSGVLSFKLTLIAVVPLMLMGILIRSTNRKTYEIGKSSVNFNQNVQHIVLEYLSAMKLVKVYQKEEDHIEGFVNANSALEEKVIKFQIATQRVKTTIEILASICIAAYIYFALVVFESNLTEVLLLIFIFARLVPKAIKVAGNYQQILNLLPAVERINKLLQGLTSNDGSHTASLQTIKKIQHGISFDKVSFSYGEASVLNAISFDIKAPGLTLLKGGSGRGKSTIIDLILGMEKANSGAILVDGKPLESYQQDAWKSLISYIPQDPYLFHSTIKENILLGNPSASEQEVWDILKSFSADQFVEKLPNGIETIVGDRGALLSGGEKQRIILARALVRKPNILILDEATNALDDENTIAIAQCLVQLKADTTIIFATHQDHFDAISDHIIDLD